MVKQWYSEMLKRRISPQYTVIKTAHYPAVFEPRGGHKVLFGIGGNIGDVVRRFEHLLVFLKTSRFVHVIETAPILKNPPFGYTQQDDFYNSLLLVETRLSPKALLRYVLHVERHFGRKRLFKDGPRTLDIDIIFYEDIVMDAPRLKLPHPGWKQRASVLIPLAMMKHRI